MAAFGATRRASRRLLLLRRGLGEWALAAGQSFQQARLSAVAARIGRRRFGRGMLARWADIVCEQSAARAFRAIGSEDIWKERRWAYELECRQQQHRELGLQVSPSILNPPPKP